MKIYTIAQIAEKCELSTSWVAAMIARGDLKATKHGNTWLVTEKQLNQYLKSREKKETDKKKEYRQLLKDHGFTYNRKKGIKRGYWKDSEYYGLTATEAYQKFESEKDK